MHGFTRPILLIYHAGGPGAALASSDCTGGPEVSHTSLTLRPQVDGEQTTSL